MIFFTKYDSSYSSYSEYKNIKINQCVCVCVCVCVRARVRACV